MCAASSISRERENKNENRDVISKKFYNTYNCWKYCKIMNKLLTIAKKEIKTGKNEHYSNLG